MSRTYPGHEVVGRIEALGGGVSRWRIGQRVGGGAIATALDNPKARAA